MMTAFAWLTGSEWGRRIALGALALAALATALLSARSAGYDSRRAEEREETVEKLRTRIRTDEDISRMDRRARADALRRWVREPAGR